MGRGEYLEDGRGRSESSLSSKYEHQFASARHLCRKGYASCSIGTCYGTKSGVLQGQTTPTQTDQVYVLRYRIEEIHFSLSYMVVVGNSWDGSVAIVAYNLWYLLQKLRLPPKRIHIT
eukprot:2302186-Amphidinium_carterae.1